MVVKVRKSSVNLREKLNELDRPAGIAGEAMLRAETKEDQFNLIGAGRKNLVINGAMDIWQRGTSSNSSGLDYFAMDRFWTYNVQGSIQRSTDVPPGETFAYSMHIDGSISAFGQPIEFPETGVSCLKKNTYYTVSFWVKGEDGIYSDKTTGQRVYVTTRYRTNKGSGTNNVNIGNGAEMFSIYPYWTRQQITFYTGNVQPDAANRFFDLEFGGLAIARGDLWFTGFQLEEGREATPFERRLPGEELALCQRYYQVLNKGRIGGVINGGGLGIVANQFVQPYMRDDPDITINGTIGLYYMAGDVQVGTSITGASSFTGYNLNLFKADGNTGDGYSFWCDFTSSAYLAFNAEL